MLALRELALSDLDSNSLENFYSNVITDVGFETKGDGTKSRIAVRGGKELHVLRGKAPSTKKAPSKKTKTTRKPAEKKEKKPAEEAKK